jgi:dolichyl-phosphate beta-glucosyltransferase
MTAVVEAGPLSSPGTRVATFRSLSVVIPAYNEEVRLPPTVESIHEFVTRHGYDAEIIVVDDGSTDRTFDAAAALQHRFSELRVLKQPRNLGKGAAVRAGVLASRRRTILFSDADLSTPIASLERLWPWLDRGYEVAVGSRSAPRSEVLRHQSFLRENMGRVFNRIIGLLGLRGFRDTQCGFKLFRAEAGKHLFRALKTRGFAFDVEILIRARRLGFKVAEVGVQWINSPDSRVHAFRDSARMLVEVLKLRGLV